MSKARGIIATTVAKANHPKARWTMSPTTAATFPNAVALGRIQAISTSTLDGHHQFRQPCRAESRRPASGTCPWEGRLVSFRQRLSIPKR